MSDPKGRISSKYTFMKILTDNGGKVKNGRQKRHIDVEWHLYCISNRLVFDPNGPISSKYTFFQRFLLVQAGPGDVNQTKS